MIFSALTIVLCFPVEVQLRLNTYTLPIRTNFHNLYTVLLVANFFECKESIGSTAPRNKAFAFFYSAEGFFRNIKLQAFRSKIGNYSLDAFSAPHFWFPIQECDSFGNVWPPPFWVVSGQRSHCNLAVASREFDNFFS